MKSPIGEPWMRSPLSNRRLFLASLARAVDEGRRARQADRVVRRVAIIVVGEDVDVQIGRFEDAQLDDRTGGKSKAR